MNYLGIMVDISTMIGILLFIMHFFMHIKKYRIFEYRNEYKNTLYKI